MSVVPVKPEPGMLLFGGQSGHHTCTQGKQARQTRQGCSRRKAANHVHHAVEAKVAQADHVGQVVRL